MAQRDDLVRAVRKARTGDQMITAVAALDAHDQARGAEIAQSRETDLSATAVRQTLEPVPLYERHTAATDWLGDYEAPSDYRTAMIAEASKWYRSLPPGLAEDPEEFREQAYGRAYTAASAYGDHALAARKEFMTYISYLSRQGASGLPQVQQTEDPKDNPAPTPLPEEAFDNFAPPQNEFNGGVEGPDHQSQISSEQAPGIQQLQQQDSSGSGFGSGPERPAEHSTSMDTSNSYAEVPLGPPGQIPTAPPGAMPSAPSTPNPAMGMGDTDMGADQRRQGPMSVAAYTRPDQDGYRWQAGRDDDNDTFGTPYHERCGSLHWPEENCHRGQEHTASVAVGYLMNAEDFARRARFESLGAQEGDAILRLGNLEKVAAHHAAIAAGFRVQARTEDEIAWLHGYLARVRPVLAKGDMGAAATCSGCGGKAGKNGGLCADCLANGAKGKKKKKNKGQPGVQGSRLDFPLAAEAAAAGDSVPLRICPQCGSTYCKHWQGRDKPYDLPGEPYGMAKDASMRKGAPFAGYADFDACVAANSDKDDPAAYCGKIKHRVEGRRRTAYYGEGIDAYHGDEGRYSEGYEGPDAEVPSHLRDSFHDLWHQDPDGWEHREPTDADRSAFRQHVQRHYSPEVYQAYFRHQGASSLPQIQEFVDSHDNPDPGGDQLNPAVMFPLNPGPGGEGEDGKAAKQAARSSMRPSNRALQLFGRLDAMEGKPAPHKDSYVFGVHGHGVYLRAHNEVRGTTDAIMGRDPVGKEKYAEQTGRPDLHAHYLGVYSDAKAGHDLDVTSRVPSERAWSNEPGGYQASLQRQAVIDIQRHTGYKGCSYCTDLATHDVSKIPVCDHHIQRAVNVMKTYENYNDDDPQARQAVRRQADTMTKPHQTTDDINSPYNSPMTTPDPWSSNEQGGDYSQGIRDGQEDAQSGEHPTFADNSSGTSPYVKGYAVGYSGRPPDTGVQDVPRSMGGDSGQAQNAQEAQRAFQVSRASLRVHGRDFSQAERESAEKQGDTLPGTTKLPIKSEQDLENAERLKGKVKGESESKIDAYLTRKRKEFGKAAFRISGAFLTRAAVDNPDFARAYKFAARWQPGMKLVRQGSPAFEAGLYAALSDRPAVQESWANEHYRLSRTHPVLGARLDAHSSFTVKFARAHGSRYLISSSGYLRPAMRRTAGTTVDLITDGPGTSPDPMGSTPLNGPGTTPPMGGGEDPARSGGPSPYQGAQPQGSGPVAPDDMLGQPQEAPQKSGPFTQTFSGRHPGNADLAPAAPNTADDPGYENADAYQGDPQRVQQAMAFRRRVQASLAASRAG